jgi:hypothetical protein
MNTLLNGFIFGCAKSDKSTLKDVLSAIKLYVVSGISVGK